MTSHKAVGHRASKFIPFLLHLLNSDLVTALGVMWQLGRRVLTAKAHEGMYEVLDFDVRLELKDAQGELATLHKRQVVRFRQNNILAYQDTAWGDGDIFADYKCSPGVAVDRYREGHRWRILISLRETKNVGDVEEFHIERTIKKGFTKKVEELQVEIDHATRRFSASVIFPRDRVPNRILLIEQNMARTTTLGPQHRHTLPDGREQVVWATQKPRLFEEYLLRWEW